MALADILADIEFFRELVIELDTEFTDRQTQVAVDLSFAEDWWIEKVSLEGELRRTRLHLKQLYAKKDKLDPREGRRSTRPRSARAGKDHKKKEPAQGPTH